MPVRFAELLEAFELLSDEQEAFVDRRTGEIHYHSDLLGDDDEWNQLPEDIEEEHYVAIPSKRDLGLGRRVAVDFASEIGPAAYREVAEIFSRRGAFGRFRTWLERHRLLDRWYDFSGKADAATLRAWCEESGLEVSD